MQPQAAPNKAAKKAKLAGSVEAAQPTALEHPEAGSGPLGDGQAALLAVPPCDLDSEGIALSHALEHGPIAGLQPKHFYSDANRRIYEAILSCGDQVDTVLVCAELRRNDRLQQCGGASYVALLAHCQPATAYPERHAEVIREAWRRRVLCDAMERLRVELRSGQLESAEAWPRFKGICEELNDA